MRRIIINTSGCLWIILFVVIIAIVVPILFNLLVLLIALGVLALLIFGGVCLWNFNKLVNRAKDDNQEKKSENENFDYNIVDNSEEEE